MSSELAKNSKEGEECQGMAFSRPVKAPKTVGLLAPASLAWSKMSPQRLKPVVVAAGRHE
jgi:hypothetical protein